MSQRTYIDYADAAHSDYVLEEIAYIAQEFVSRFKSPTVAAACIEAYGKIRAAEVIDNGFGYEASRKANGKMSPRLRGIR